MTEFRGREPEVLLTADELDAMCEAEADDGDGPFEDRDRVGEILERLTSIEEKVDEVFARVKKTNSLAGMLIGRSAPPKGKAK